MKVGDIVKMTNKRKVGYGQCGSIDRIDATTGYVYFTSNTSGFKYIADPLDLIVISTMSTPSTAPVPTLPVGAVPIKIKSVFRKDDRVKVIKPTSIRRNSKGTVVEIVGEWVRVKFWNHITPISYHAEHLELTGTGLEGFEITAKKCECGCTSVGVSKHSDYCPLYNKAQA
jgi:hypothetical protein